MRTPIAHLKDAEYLKIQIFKSVQNFKTQFQKYLLSPNTLYQEQDTEYHFLTKDARSKISIVLPYKKMLQGLYIEKALCILPKVTFDEMDGYINQTNKMKTWLITNDVFGLWSYE